MENIGNKKSKYYSNYKEPHFRLVSIGILGLTVVVSSLSQVQSSEVQAPIVVQQITEAEQDSIELEAAIEVERINAQGFEPYKLGEARVLGK